MMIPTGTFLICGMIFTPEKPPYYLPNGLSISSSTKRAVTSLEFTENAMDVFCLEQNSAGSFCIAIDGI